MPVNHADLARQSSGAGLVILTPDENLPNSKRIYCNVSLIVTTRTLFKCWEFVRPKGLISPRW